MTDQNQKKQDKRKGNINPVAVAITGAVIGAGVAVAGAVILKDKKNREKVKQAFTNVKDQAVEYIEDMQKEAKDKKGKVEKKLAEGKEKVGKITSSVKDSFQHAVKDAKKAAHTN